MSKSEKMTYELNDKALDDNQDMTAFRKLFVPFLKEPLTVEEAQAFAGLSRSYLYQLMYEHKIPYYKPSGNKICFKRSEPEAFPFRNGHATDREISDGADKILYENQKKRKGLKI
jgi:excisionase family DNA binding protein